MTGGIIQVYSKCPYCGIDGMKIRSIKKYADKTDAMLAITSIKHYKTARDPGYTEYIKKSKLPIGTSIMVFDGEDIQELKSWNL